MGINMNIVHWAGWGLAIICAVGWWVTYRGLAGIKSDLINARNEIKKRVK